MSEEEKKEEVKKEVEVKEEVKEEPKEDNSTIERANKAAERLEAATKAAAEIADKQEKILVEMKLGGKTEAGEPNKKVELSPEEYAEKVLKGEVNPLDVSDESK